MTSRAAGGVLLPTASVAATEKCFAPRMEGMLK